MTSPTRLQPAVLCEICTRPLTEDEIDAGETECADCRADTRGEERWENDNDR